MLIGQRVMPGGLHGLADRADPQYAAAEVRKIVAECRAAAAQMPKQTEFIDRYCKAVQPEMA